MPDQPQPQRRPPRPADLYADLLERHFAGVLDPDHRPTNREVALDTLLRAAIAAGGGELRWDRGTQFAADRHPGTVAFRFDRDTDELVAYLKDPDPETDDGQQRLPG